jgi:[acyl-carrier-protein] S-malonyltransferase
MVTILGLDLPAIEEACREAAEGEIVSPANVNSPGQVVIAGNVAAVDRASERCRAKGAKRAVKLPVSAPFHCSLMQPARDRLLPELQAIAFHDPATPLVNNVDARIVRDAGTCREGLVRQVSDAVRWQESVELLAREGVTTFVEVGPGTVLSGLVRKIARGTRVLNVDSPESLEAAVAALRAEAEE